MTAVVFAYFVFGLSICIANEHKNELLGNIVIILLWPIMVLALIIKKALR